MLWTDCCVAETSQHSQREGYETLLKGLSEPSHGTLGEKAGENKKTIRPDRLASLRWAVLCLPGLLADKKIKDKLDPTDNWMGIFNRPSCDLNSASGQDLQDSWTKGKGRWGLRQGEDLAKMSLKNPPVRGLPSIACLLQGTLQHEDPAHPWPRLLAPTRAQRGEGLRGITLAVGCGLARSWSPPAHVERRPAYNSRSGIRRGDFCSLVAFMSTLCRGEVMRTMTRTKDNWCDRVEAILKRLVLNG